MYFGTKLLPFFSSIPDYISKKKINSNITSKMPASTISICMHKFKIYTGCFGACKKKHTHKENPQKFPG